jgi:type I restriction enzyme, S subunit
MNKKLGILADIHYGKSSSEVLLEDGAYPIVGTGGIYGQARKAMFSSAVVVPRKGSLGNPQLIEIPFWPVDTTYAVLPKKNVNIRWLYYCLLNFDLTKLNEATGVPSISRDWLSKVEFDDPGYYQQQKICDILFTIDQTIAHTEALIQKYQQIKAGLMHDLFTRGITSDGQLRPPREEAPELYQETAIGWIPREWTVSSCSDLFSIDSGITLGPHRRPNRNPHPYLRVANVFREKITVDDISKLEASDEEAGRYRLNKYDLLLVEGHANRQEIGRCAMVFNNSEGMLFQNHLFRLRAIILDSWYALFLLNSHLSRGYWEMKCSTSSGLNTINKRMLSNMPLCVPRPEEQILIATLIKSHNQKLAMEATKLNKLLLLKSGLMHDLLTGKVPVTISES